MNRVLEAVGRIVDGFMRQLPWFAGMLAAISVAIGGQAEMISEPWRHYVAVVGIVATAICAYMLQHPWTGRERRTNNTQEGNPNDDGL